jgi:hypothetical protein
MNPVFIHVKAQTYTRAIHFWKRTKEDAATLQEESSSASLTVTTVADDRTLRHTPINLNRSPTSII